MPDYDIIVRYKGKSQKMYELYGSFDKFKAALKQLQRMQEEHESGLLSAAKVYYGYTPYNVHLKPSLAVSFNSDTNTLDAFMIFPPNYEIIGVEFESKWFLDDVYQATTNGTYEYQNILPGNFYKIGLQSKQTKDIFKPQFSLRVEKNIFIPEAPVNVTSKVIDATTVKLDWDDVPHPVDTFKVYAKKVSTSSQETILTGPSVTKKTFKNLTQDEQYEFWVTAIVDGVEGAESSHVFETPVVIPCDISISNVSVSAITPAQLALNGSNQYADLGTMAGIENYLALHTIEIKFKSNSNSQQQLFGGYQNSISNGDIFGQRYQLRINKPNIGDVFLGIQTDSNELFQGNANPVANINDGLVHHLAVRVDKANGTLTFILDGTVLSTSFLSANQGINFIPWHIDLLLGANNTKRDGTGGVGTPNNYLSGNLDEFRIWKTLRTNQELIDNKSKTMNPAVDTDLIFYYRCDDGAGNTLTEDITNTDGTLVGNVSDNMWVAGDL